MGNRRTSVLWKNSAQEICSSDAPYFDSDSRPDEGGFFMVQSLKAARPGVRVRHLYRRIRHSNAVSLATDFFTIQRRRFRQRLHSRFVRGVHLRTTDYLNRQPSAEWGQYIEMTEFERKINIAPPTFVPHLPAEKIGGRITARSGPRGVALLNQPWVVGPSGAVIGKDRKLLWDLSYEWPGWPHQHTTYELMELPATTLPGSTVTLAAMGADKNYFHFLLNSVARLVYLKRAFLPFVSDHYLISGAVTDFVADTLALFGISRDRVIGTADFPAFRPARLIAPALIHHPFVVPAHVCEFVRTTVLPNLSPRSSARRRIFIDRSDAPARRIQNLPELTPLLAKFGIEVVQLSGMSVAQQAILFRDADLVIANHGAALTNLIFCEPGTRVLQVLAPGMMEREYRTISQHSRLRHDYVVADFASGADARIALKQRDLIFPPSLLRTVLAAET